MTTPSSKAPDTSESRGDTDFSRRGGTDPPEAGPTPRAFAMGTGWVFQSVGLLFLLGACFFWALSAGFIKPAEEPAEHWLEYFRGEHLPVAVLAVCLATTFIGGAGLIGVGIGLQGERPGSGRVAMIITAAMVLLYGGSCGLLVVNTGGWFSSLVAAFFAVWSLILFLLARHSALVLRKFPPPPDQNVVTDEWLEQYKDRRRQTR